MVLGLSFTTKVPLVTDINQRGNAVAPLVLLQVARFFLSVEQKLITPFLIEFVLAGEALTKARKERCSFQAAIRELKQRCL